MNLKKLGQFVNLKSENLQIRNLEIENLVSHFHQILWRWAPEHDEDPRRNFYKFLDMNFISIKNMKWTFGNFSIFK